MLQEAARLLSEQKERNHRELVPAAWLVGWLAPQSAIAQTVPDTIVPPATSPDSHEFKAISLDLAALRQKVDQLAASQQQMTRDFSTRLHADEQEILDKISVLPSQPAAAPARKPVPTPLQVAPVR
jgi:hypothetical protein